MEWFKFRMSWRKPMMKLTNEEAGKVIKALLAYAYSEEEQETGGMGDIILCQMTETLQADLGKYRETADRRKQHAQAAAEARWQKNDAHGHDEHNEACTGHTEENRICRNKNKETDSETESEKEREPEAETERKMIEGSEPLSAVSELPAAEIPLNDGSEYPLFRKDLDEYARLYPAVDVEQEMRNMRGWCMSNPTRRKTRRGVRTFINNWLSREQDRAGRRPEPPPNPFLAYARGEKTSSGVTLF